MNMAGPWMIHNLIQTVTELFIMNAELALYTLIPVPALLWMVLKFSKISRPLFRKAQKEIAEVIQHSRIIFRGLKRLRPLARRNTKAGR
jgi:ATP-binding cassette subfamily B protein/subfamily B ATP-binding cassette protein MsbA